MASNDSFIEVILTENDVPGAKLLSKDISQHSVIQLQRWLECRGLKKTGKKHELVQRVQVCINSGQDKDISITVDNGKWYSQKAQQVLSSRSVDPISTPSQDDVPTTSNQLPQTGWQDFPHRNLPTNFNYGNIYHYMLESVQFITVGGQEDGDDLNDQDGGTSDHGLSHMTGKPLQRGKKYVQSKYVVNVQDNTSEMKYFARAEVLPSMAGSMHPVCVTLSQVSGAVLGGSCNCVASALGRCSHIAALLLQLWEYKKIISKGEAPTSTDLPCKWNKGSKRKNPQRVHEAHYSSYSKDITNIIKFDPRPPESRRVTQEQINGFVIDLQKMTNGAIHCMWETTFCLVYSDYSLSSERKGVLQQLVEHLISNITGYHQAPYMVPGTIEQSSTPAWQQHRWLRITASIAKKASNLGFSIMKNDLSTVTMTAIQNFIATHFWGMKDNVQTAAMSHGLEMEGKARDDYCRIKKKLCSDYMVEPTGLWINPKYPYLACSPDGVVHDPSSSACKSGLLEIKVLKLLQKYSPADLKQAVSRKEIASSKISSSCFKIKEGGELELRRSHVYYYQVQFQMAVTGLTWCDFVLWSSEGDPSIERIYKDTVLCASMLEQCTALWKRVIAPELFEMRVPRNLHPFIL